MAVRLDMPHPSSRPLLLPVGRVDPSRLKCHDSPAGGGVVPAVAIRTARRAPQAINDFFHIACHVRKPDRRS